MPTAGTAARHYWMRQQLKLYLVMGSINCTAAPEQVLRQAIAGGITMFQYREKGDGARTGQAAAELARRLQNICRQHSIPFIVNDDLELALSLQADGIHVGQSDLPASLIREQLGTDKIVGVSAHSLTEASCAIAAGADYLGIGPIYPTRSKADAEPVRGTAVIEQLRHAGMTLPLVGIGGIDTSNAAAVVESGADGVAVISSIAGQSDPAAAATALARLV
ncbi:thiamine phosphate synthase [Paenibacillus campi]|uniref:thiamine phosphate synthase n=1 Tax=Paenibacillus campi TaxID=3106031 RepID=UPI003A4C7BA6